MANSDRPALSDSSQRLRDQKAKPGSSRKQSNEGSILSVPFRVFERLVDTIDLLKDQPTLVALMIISLAVSVITIFVAFKDMNAGLYICIAALFILLVIVIAIAVPYLREGLRSAKILADAQFQEQDRPYRQRSPRPPRPRPSPRPQGNNRSKAGVNDEAPNGGHP